MRRFELHRDSDETGTSGTGVVVQGVEFDDGYAAITWIGRLKSWCVYPSVTMLMEIHGHDGATRLVYLDTHPDLLHQFHREIRMALEGETDQCRYHGAQFGEIEPWSGLPRCESCRQPYRVTLARRALAGLEQLARGEA